MSSLKDQNYENENALTKNPWYDCLMNYIPKHVKQTLCNVKYKIMSLFKTSTAENCTKPVRVNNAYRGRKKPRKQPEIEGI